MRYIIKRALSVSRMNGILVAGALSGVRVSIAILKVFGCWRQEVSTMEKLRLPDAANKILNALKLEFKTNQGSICSAIKPYV